LNLVDKSLKNYKFLEKIFPQNNNIKNNIAAHLNQLKQYEEAIKYAD